MRPELCHERVRYRVQLEKYVLCANVRVDLSGDTKSKRLNVWVFSCSCNELSSDKLSVINCRVMK